MLRGRASVDIKNALAEREAFARARRQFAEHSWLAILRQTTDSGTRCETT